MSDLDIIDDGAVRQIFINRPANGNAISFDTRVSLRAAFERADAESSIRAIVLSGRGKIFCAGADVKEWRSKTDDDTPPGGGWGPSAKALILTMADLKKPIVAAVNGAAAGAGVDLACACDFRIAADNARFICSYTRVGFCPDAGGSWFLPRLIGLAAAKRFIFFGDPWDAEACLASGLVDRVVAADTLQVEALGFARRLAAGPTIAIGEGKRLLNAAFTNTLAEQIDAEHAVAAICRVTEDHREGLAAAGEKRTPVFVGR